MARFVAVVVLPSPVTELVTTSDRRGGQGKRPDVGAQLPEGFCPWRAQVIRDQGSSTMSEASPMAPRIGALAISSAGYCAPTLDLCFRALRRPRIRTSVRPTAPAPDRVLPRSRRSQWSRGPLSDRHPDGRDVLPRWGHQRLHHRHGLPGDLVSYVAGAGGGAVLYGKIDEHGVERNCHTDIPRQGLGARPEVKAGQTGSSTSGEVMSSLKDFTSF